MAVAVWAVAACTPTTPTDPGGTTTSTSPSSTTSTTVLTGIPPIVLSGTGTCGSGVAPPAVGAAICQYTGQAVAEVEVFPHEVVTAACPRYGVETITSVVGTLEQGGSTVPLPAPSSFPYGRWHVVTGLDATGGPITLRLTSVVVDPGTVVCV